MANLLVKDANGAIQNVDGGGGDGSSGNPFKSSLIALWNASLAAGANVLAAVSQAQYSTSPPVTTSGNYVTLQGSAHGDLHTVIRNLQVSPVVLFDQTTNQAGVSQRTLLFPTTVALTGSALPAKDSGTAGIVPVTNSGNVCGAVWAPREEWGSVLLDIAGVGATASETLTLEIFRLKAPGAIPDVLASVVLTASSQTLVAAVNPFTGAAHTSVTWRFFDIATVTSYQEESDLSLSLGGSSGTGPTQLCLKSGEVTWYGIQITSLNAAFSEVVVVLTPVGKL